MTTIETIRHGIVLWLVLLCTMPGGFFHKQRGARTHEPAPPLQIAAQSDSAELRDTETSYRHCRFRRYRRSERASEVVETLRSRNESHASSSRTEPITSPSWRETDVCIVNCTRTPLLEVPLRC